MGLVLTEVHELLLPADSTGVNQDPSGPKEERQHGDDV